MPDVASYIEYIISFFTQLFHSLQETFANLFT
jgi:hypothetical protein